MIHVTNFIKIGSGIQKLIRSIHRQHGDLISPYLFFLNKESRLKIRTLASAGLRICLSESPNVTTREPLNGISGNFLSEKFTKKSVDKPLFGLQWDKSSIHEGLPVRIRGVNDV
jgi:hypothetical protein